MNQVGLTIEVLVLAGIILLRGSAINVVPEGITLWELCSEVDFIPA